MTITVIFPGFARSSFGLAPIVYKHPVRTAL